MRGAEGVLGNQPRRRLTDQSSSYARTYSRTPAAASIKSDAGYSLRPKRAKWGGDDRRAHRGGQSSDGNDLVWTDRRTRGRCVRSVTPLPSKSSTAGAVESTVSDMRRHRLWQQQSEKDVRVKPVHALRSAGTPTIIIRGAPAPVCAHPAYRLAQELLQPLRRLAHLSESPCLLIRARPARGTGTPGLVLDHRWDSLIST